jgi:drug/metabolite transporter (DMT)-like permease
MKDQLTVNTPAPKYLPIFLFVVLSLIWGSSFILIKRGLDFYEPGQVGALRVVFSFLVLLPWAIPSLSKIPKNKLGYVVITGFLGNLIPAFLFATAETSLASSIAGVLNGLTPIFAFVIGIVCFRTAWKKEQLLGLIIGFIGTIGLSLVQAEGALGSINQYAILVVIATICYGINVNLLKIKLGDVEPLPLTAVAMLSIGPVALLYLSTTNFWTVVGSTPASWYALGYLAILGIVGTAIALVLFNILIQMTSTVFATAVTYVIPVVAVMWGVLDGEQLYTMHYIGMVLILIGVYMVNKWK